MQKHQEATKNKELIVLDPKRSNSINIGMTKLPPPRTIKTAILKMDSTIINREGIEVFVVQTLRTLNMTTHSIDATEIVDHVADG